MDQSGQEHELGEAAWGKKEWVDMISRTGIRGGHGQ